MYAGIIRINVQVPMCQDDLLVLQDIHDVACSSQSLISSPSHAVESCLALC